MVFPINEDPEERRAAREEWFEIAEEEQIAEGDISTSETVDGHDPMPDLDDDEDMLENEFDEGMHIGDIEDEGGSDDPVDHYLEGD
jgi:hypothetical protein